MNFIRKFLAALSGKAEPDEAPSRAPVTPPAPAVSEEPELDLDDIEATDQAAREAGSACLDRHWAAVGTLERDVLGYLISPGLSGGIPWPSTRQAYRVVRRGDGVILASDGLSDPFDGAQGLGNGFEMEVFVETPDIPEHVRGSEGNVDPLKHSWAFELIEHVAGTVANAGGITPQLNQYGVLSMELPGVSQSRLLGEQLPPHMVSEDDCVGILLGFPEPDFPTLLQDMPLSPVRLVPVVLITAEELAYVRSGGREAREDLVQRLIAAGVGHRSILHRDSVI